MGQSIQGGWHCVRRTHTHIHTHTHAHTVHTPTQHHTLPHVWRTRGFYHNCSVLMPLIDMIACYVCVDPSVMIVTVQWCISVGEQIYPNVFHIRSAYSYT